MNRVLYPFECDLKVALKRIQYRRFRCGYTNPSEKIQYHG